MSRFNITIKKSTIILFMMVGFFNTTLISQVLSQTDSTLHLLLVKADSLRKENQYNLAKPLFNLAKKKAERNTQWDNWFSAVIGLTRMAIIEKKELAFADSLILYSEVVPTNEAHTRAELFLYTASLLTRAGRNAQSIKYYNKALPIYKELRDSSRYLSCIKNLSNKYAYLGDFHSALKITDEGLKYLGENKRHQKYADYLNNKGGYHLYLNNYNQAISYYRQALLYSQDPIGINLNLLQAYTRNGDIDNAKNVISQLKSIDSIYLLNLYKFRSEYYESSGNLAKAIDDQIKASNQSRSHVNHRILTRELVTLAKLYLKNNNKTEAKRIAHSAISNHYEEVDSLDYYSFPKDSDAPDIYIIEASYIKAKVHAREYELNKNSKDLEAATFYYDFMFKVFENLKHNIFTDDSNYRLGAYSQGMYFDAIAFNLEQYKMTNDNQYYNKAFTISQLANSFVLKNKISERKALELAQVPLILSNEFLELKNILAQTIKENDALLLDSLITPYNKLKSEISNKYPGYISYTKEELITFREVQKELGDAEVLIKYHSFDDKLLAFVIGKNKFGYEELKHGNNLDKEIDELNKLIIQSATNYSVEQEEHFAKLSKKIHDQVFLPLTDNDEFQDAQQLYIIPDGPMKEISFNVLMHRESDGWSDYKDFLLDKYNISYLYFASQLQQANLSNNQGQFVGFGIQYQDAFLQEVMKTYLDEEKVDSLYQNGSRSASLSVLKHALSEVQACAQLLNGLSILEEKATRRSITENLPSAQIAHFAVHALVDKDDFQNSYILLNQAEDERFDLNFEDILNLGLNNDLVVLSACQTGIGQNIQGEGLMSLARAFVQGGSQASMGSYWNAPDKATMQLMTLFYKNLKAGLNKSEALRSAQLQYLSDDNLSSPSIRTPFYWAGWTIYGNNAAIDIRKGIGVKSILLGLGLLLLLVFLFIRKRV